MGWLTNTSGSFENLIVTRHWKMAYLPVNPCHKDVQGSLGFTSDECGTGLSVWLRAVFNQVPTLDTFSLVSTYTGTEPDESSLPMRRTTFTRLDFMSARKPKGVDETYIDVEHLVARLMSHIGSGSGSCSSRHIVRPRRAASVSSRASSMSLSD